VGARRKDTSELRSEAASAVEKGKLRQALTLYEQLEHRQPTDAAWPKRLGDLHKRDGNEAQAVACYERAVDKYAAAGFLVQAIAVCKLILQIDSEHTGATSRLAEHAPSPRRVVREDAVPQAVPIEPGAAIDSMRLSTVVPGAKRQQSADGGMNLSVIPLDDEDVVEIELDDHSQRHTAIDLAIANAEPVVQLPPATPYATPQAKRALLTTPLLADLPPGALERLVARLALVELAPGEVLFREGDAGTCLYVVSEGEVVVESAAAGELAWLGPGSFFGEIALVTDLPRSATIRAGAAPALLLAIDRDVVREQIAAHPVVLGVILRFVRDRLVAKVLRTSELFRPFDDVERMALTSKFELIEVEAGTPLIVQGQRADGLYVTLAGKVEVWRDGSPGKVATLGAGEVFGEMSLLAGGGSTAHCRAATRVLALRMPQKTFQVVIMTHPQVLQYVGELAERRRPKTDAPEVNEADFSDIHLELL
jgi:CRP-like cAMP-binding protein